jgi:hypothetical protein
MVYLAIIAAALLIIAAGIAAAYCLIREVDDPDDLPAPPFVRTTIIGPDLSMARAACEAGYISNKEYIDRVAEAQADALAFDLSAFTRATFQRPRKTDEQREQPA